MSTTSDQDINLRPLFDSDKKRLAELCNNINIWRNLRDAFPHPYLEKDALAFIQECHRQNPQTVFAIVYKGELSGCVRLVPQQDIYRFNAELGYWIGDPFWGLGIASDAVGRIVKYGFETLKLVRIFSSVFGFNKASQKVLEKNGFQLECIAEKSVYKDGRLLDEHRFFLLNRSHSLYIEAQV